MTPPSAPLVLVADDNDTARYTKGRILRQAGFDVIDAASGSEALRAVEERAPRLVVLDVHMPDVNGWEVCRRIQEDPATASVLVLQVSATYVSEADTVRALEGGADACLTEPIEPPVLVATVKALLRARQAEDELREVLAREQETRASAEAANRMKDEFLATLSHELRSPLGAILTWVTLLRGGGLDQARTQRGLEAIERNTRLQVKLIEDLLDVSRIISGKLNIDVGLVELPSIIEAAIDNNRAALDAKGIRLESSIDASFGPISGDASRLQQVVWNLLSNAVKFTPKGGRIHISVENVESSAEIRVSDTGRGIDPEFLPHIFERFRQADSSSTRMEGGLGLGLAIVRHLVEMHGGTVEAGSEGLGRGATFIVKLPLPAVRLGDDVVEEATAQFPAAAIAEPVLEGARILVLDDERDAREAIAAVLERGGAAVEAFPSVSTAIAAIEMAPPEVIVSDIAMPEEDGYDFIRRLRSLPKDASKVPVLALTAYAGADNRSRVVAAGFETCLTKPIEATVLLAAVADLVRRARRRDSSPA
jgi:signal transduction histidine kinase